MAEEEKQEAEETNPEGEGEEPTSGKKKGIYLGGGVLGLIVVAYMASMMAVPAKVQVLGFHGPFVAPLTESQMQVNLAAEGSRRFMVLNLSAVYDAYDETYAPGRLLDPLYLPLLQDALIEVGSQKTREQVTTPSEREIFKIEMRDAADPILFPVHVGDASSPYEADGESGLGPGESVYDATLRGPHHLHVIHIDSVAKTLQLDEGDVVSYQGNETNLELIDEKGAVIFVDTTGIVDGFMGDVSVGVQGRIRRITFMEFLVQ